MLKVGDLFAGIGGIALGFKNAGFDISWANEFDQKACTTYKTNFKHTLYETDIKNLNPKMLQKVDVLAGGFPCQAFSIAGYQKGFADERGNLFFEIMRLADEIKPFVIFLENVKNLVSHDNGNTFSVILKELENRKYFVKSKVLNTCEYSDVPQNRERIYIVAFKNKKHYDFFDFPEKMDAKKHITQLIDKEACEEFYYNKSKYYDKLKDEITDTDAIYQWRRIYLRKNKSGVCPTLTANMGTGGHNVPLIRDSIGIRKLTPRECARFQGFPDTFKFPSYLPKSALYKQIGNSVSVPVVEIIAKNIKLALNNENIVMKKTYNIPLFNSVNY